MTVDGDLIGVGAPTSTSGIGQWQLTGTTSDTGGANRRIWTIPEGVASFSLFASIYGVSGAWYDIPATVGEQWVFETGDLLGFDRWTRTTRNTANGGAGILIGGGGGWGEAGSAAWLITRIPAGGTEEMWWCFGGAGGGWAAGSGIIGPSADPIPGPVAYGSPTSLSGLSEGASGAGVPAGAGGGGWPGGDAGATPGAPGEGGGSYLADVDGTSFGGTASPTFEEAFGVPFDPDTSGGFRVLLFQPLSGGAFDAIPM